MEVILKKIGIIGGLGPEVTIDYYLIIIQSSIKEINEGTPEIIICRLDLKKFPNIMKDFDNMKQFSMSISARAWCLTI